MLTSLLLQLRSLLNDNTSSRVHWADSIRTVQALGVLARAKSMGIQANTIMYNTAMSALAKSGHADAAEMLFGDIPEPDSVSYETLIAAYGMAGEPNKAENVMVAMESAGYIPRDYAYCGLVAAYR